MLVNYLVDIYTDANAEDDASAGFSGAAYHFSTAPADGYLQCLDGSSFSAVSQQNAIVCGGELSMMDKVEITVASRAVSNHIRGLESALLGNKASMRYKLGNRTEQAVFSNMRIASFAEKSEISFTITLEDSSFAMAAPCLLKQPLDDALNNISTRIGEKTWLPLKKISERNGFCGQGKLDIGELEYSVPRKNGKPCFPRSFPIEHSNSNIPDNSVKKPSFYIGDKVEAGGLKEGMTVEIHTGAGAGDKYKINSVKDENGWTALDLFPSPSDKVLGMNSLGRRLRPLPGTLNDWKGLYAWDIEHPLVIFPSEDESLASLRDVSFWRIADASQIYYVSFGKKAELQSSSDSPNIGVMNKDGGIEEICRMELVPLESGDGYQLFIDRSNMIIGDKIYLDDFIPVAPRYDLNRGATRLYYQYPPPDGCVWETLRIDGEAAQLSSASENPPEDRSVVFKLRNEGIYDLNQLHYNYPQISVYWRIDEIGDLENVDSIYPHFLTGFTNAWWLPMVRAMLLDDSLTVMQVKDYSVANDGLNDMHGVMETMPQEMADALTFEKKSFVNAKYLYLQIGFNLGWNENNLQFDVLFRTRGLRCRRSYPLDKAYVKAERQDAIRNPIQLARIICGDNDINVDSVSMDEASTAISNDIYGTDSLEMPSIEVANGAIWEEKLSELCRAANFSLFSDGGGLRAKYWIADRLKNLIEWTICEKDIVADSYDITSLKNEGIATDYAFSVPTKDGIKTMGISAPGKDDEFEDGRLYADDRVLDVMDGTCRILMKSVRAATILMYVHLPESNERSEEFAGLVLGRPYEFSFEMYGEHTLKLILLDMQLNETYISCIFESADKSRKISVLSDLDKASGGTLRTLKHKEEWEAAIGGNLRVDYHSAEWLFFRAQAALLDVKNHIKMDERYTKHKAMVFTSPETWLKSILNTVAHNTYKKVLVKFSVPLDMLPEQGLPSLVLKYARLEFGRFKKYPISGWVIGYSLDVAEDKVDIAFLSSEPMKNVKWYDENDLENQTILDETESPDKSITEAQ